MGTSAAQQRPRLLWARVVGCAAFALVVAYALLVLATEAPGVLALLVVVGVVTMDVLLISMAAKRRGLATAVWCAVIALVAALAQGLWVYIPFRWDVLAPSGDGVAWFGSALVVALLLSVGLVARPESRPFGWALLMGSSQGFVASFLVLLAAFAAAMGAD